MKAIEKAIETTKTAFPSIYTKDDVIKLLKDLESEVVMESIQMTSNAVEEVQANLAKKNDSKVLKPKYDMDDFYNMVRSCVRSGVNSMDDDEIVTDQDFDITNGNEISVTYTVDKDEIIETIMREIESECDDILDMEEVEEEENKW